MTSAVRRFFAFWSDFLVGDRPELFFGPIVSLGVAWAVVTMGLDGAAAGVLLVAMICATVSLSLWRALPR